MKTNNMYKKESRTARFPYALSIKSVILGAVILLGIQTTLQAQDSIQYTRPSWYFGVAAGGNINFYRGSTQQLNADLTVPTTFQDGKGLGLYVTPLIEYRPANSRWGIMFQAGYDSRKGAFNGVNTPCNCPADLITDLSYLTVEPSLRFAPFKSNFYLYGGPRLAFNLTKGFSYRLGINPAFPNQPATPDVDADFSSIRSNLISMQIGAGYDIQLSNTYHKTQWVLSPFVSFQPYFGQDPRSIETWNISTLRVGAALKLGTGRKIVEPVKETLVEKTIVIAEPKVILTVNSPKNIVAERKVREIFPLRNYIFFDLDSDEIPNRYVLLKKDQVKAFNENEMDMPTPKNLSGRSDRQMKVYYNILNIVGKRMVENPSSNIVLVGSSAQGSADGLEMAQSVKDYLVNIFGINPNRITIEGRNKPVLAAVQKGGTIDIVMLREGDRRVTIESNSPALLMEFQSGPNAPLKPIEILSVQEAPIDSYFSVKLEGAEKAFTSWRLEMTDESGVVQNYGPYTQETVAIPGKTILGNKTEGNYKVRIIGTTKNAKTVTKDATTHIVLWKAAVTETGTRFSVLYDFNNSRANGMYQKYLTSVVTPKIPANATVVIHGHTDIVGDDSYNQRLSLARANDVKSIMENALSKLGRKDVTFQILGLGEDEKTAPFENKYAEERFYNRTVIIDIIPQK